MAGESVYIRHHCGRQRLVAEAELSAYEAEGWTVERRIEVESMPKKKAAKKPAAKKKA